LAYANHAITVKHLQLNHIGIVCTFAKSNVFNSFFKSIGDVEVIDKVQRRATKRVIQLKKLPYTERRKYIDIHTLKYRRISLFH